ncbi:MAG TPA: hypothetical protein VIG89_07110 [Candidatus Acidoferrales bacterium]
MSNRTKVFIAGSRRLSRLNKDLRQRIDNIIEKNFTVIVGDANGADKAVQDYLNSRRYTRVVVFCMEGHCRNNIGKWPSRTITAADPLRKDFAYYSAKDRAMGEDADYGLMLWDGRSRGTLASIVHLVQKGKPVVVYVAPEKSFYTLHQPDHLAQILHQLDPVALHRIDRELQAVAMGSGSSGKVKAALLF